MVQMETQLQSIFEEVVKTEIIEEAFPGMFMDTPEDEKTKLISCLGAFRQFWGGLSQESHEQCIQWIVKFIHGQHSPKRISFLYDCLAMAVETGLLPPRMVCESLINSDTLEWERTQLWALTFKLVRKIIGGVDYKGVRDLLKVILEKTLTIPNTVSSAVVQQLLAAREVIAYILERNACLLPAYFAVTEIRKLYPEGKLPHWLLGNLVSDFVDTFRPTARINSICGRCSLLPVVNNSGAICNSWKLDPATLRFPLKGLLPYDKDLFEPQTALLRYVLEQPYSRDMVCNMLGLNKQTLNIAQHKQRCPVLEDQLVDLVVYAMERSETEEKFDDGGTSQLLWQHLSSQLIFFVLFQFASFPHMVLSLHQKLAGRGLIKGRDHLMWVLLQFISGSIQKNALADFLPVMKLFDLLYPEKEFIPVPDINKPQSTHAFAMTCIWIHLNRKAQNDNSKLQIPIPHSLKLHHEFLQQSLRNKSLQMNDYKIALLCNAYSTNSECFTLPMGALVETIYGNGIMRIPLPGTSCLASGSITPLPMNLLDSLTVHAKMSLIHSIATRVIKLAHAKSSVALAPALVETYSRLLVYMEIESLGIKGFISQLLPTVFKSHAWGILHTLLEMFSYRMHHIQPHYRVQLLSHLHTLAAVAQTNQNQLHLCVESTALRLITALGSSEVQPQFTRFLSDPKTVLSAESEELNRALILTLARATHVTDRPVTYLYNTLHYYEMHLRNRESLKRKLVHAIIGSLKDNRPQGWCLSDTYLKCAMNAREDNPWVPDDSYYCKLIGRLVDTMAGKSPGPFPNCDWRFNEFPNPAAHALHVTCVELMALAVSGQDVGNALLNVVLKSQPLVPRENITAWMNAIGLIITALPEPYWIVLHDRIVSVISSPSLTSETEWVGYPFRLFDFTACHQSYSEMSCSYTLALAHAVWHHSSIGQLSLIPKFLTEVLLPIVKTEFQLLYVYHLVGPFLQRFQQERTRCMIEIGVAFYDMLLNVDQCSTHLNYMDPICDFLYHMKYMFTGDSVKEQVEKIICNLKPALKLRLRFITHISKMEPAAVPPQAINSGSPAPQSNQVPVSLPVTQ
ncbi:mediator of RNA polymerase II transcription subunit 23 isoform X9 [Sagmatias obliquidens]|uniref:mediator of RNA polymerase II transcription subunit 23 isoform X9 n=1 Tax=Sagmatias obliquidens TaxID=3371155 RepID=UPI0009525CC8|nr:mediator of RNA polymerase II transcription subunit 23 isoform X9 [Lagenorhynchus obliquidens]XP_030709304.1 mediator of RNA polymerase II transcription subunit 23 isoform X9 [Globicephala melas]